ncbi:methionine biosynthesis protein MetW [Desulfobulbus oralis]|uniref:Methionine biosynthesis protein MetW n=1 Tax=Desulfobulbus oralis TaxID=1986146 RepID=A0A2L1GPP4_9BACT|nr:methionine biosynthesis protein MetW [Desulfobulbus oralis]AVD71650.1 methionine biosynthesis protein MetW [Desulfobulbus oralis]
MHTVSDSDRGGALLRYDLQVIASWIAPGERVLDLGCGNGDLLAHLRDCKQVQATGIELDESKVARCIQRGLTVLQGDFCTEIGDYPDNCFDVVILSQTLQQIGRPHDLLLDMLRVGRRAIVSFPNFAHWRVRLQMLACGRAPITDQLPYAWYDTPNIRVLSIGDFQRFMRRFGMQAVREVAINTHHHETRGHQVRTLTNLRATYGIFMLEKEVR